VQHNAQRSRARRQAHLQVSLWLHEAAHAAKGSDQLALLVCHQARHDGVVGPLARRQAVGVARVQVEAMAAVLQAETASLVQAYAEEKQRGSSIKKRLDKQTQAPCMCLSQ
jgi:hypothetical protein